MLIGPMLIASSFTVVVMATVTVVMTTSLCGGLCEALPLLGPFFFFSLFCLLTEQDRLISVTFLAFLGSMRLAWWPYWWLHQILLYCVHQASLGGRFAFGVSMLLRGLAHSLIALALTKCVYGHGVDLIVLRWHNWASVAVTARGITLSNQLWCTIILNWHHAILVHNGAFRRPGRVFAHAAIRGTLHDDGLKRLLWLRLWGHTSSQRILNDLPGNYYTEKSLIVLDTDDFFYFNSWVDLDIARACQA